MVNGRYFKEGKWIFLSVRFRSIGLQTPDTAPKKVSFQVTVKQGKGILIIYNTWRNERGIVHSMYYGAAMVRENIENGARYRCNDGHPDEDFDDLIFTLIKTKGSWEFPLEEAPQV